MTLLDERVGFDLTQVDQLLTTTRSVRRRLDLEKPVHPETIRTCLQLAIHAPTAEDRQNWRWLVLTDPDKRRIVADYYRLSWINHSTRISGKRRGRWRNADRNARTQQSAQWLADHMAEVPVLVLPCVLGAPISDREAALRDKAWGAEADSSLSPARLVGDSTFYGSIFPAIWSFQLALRSRGLASCITSLHLPFYRMVAQELGIPGNITQIALLPVAYLRGDSIGPAPRRPAEEVTIWNEWLPPSMDGSVREYLLQQLADRDDAAD